MVRAFEPGLLDKVCVAKAQYFDDGPSQVLRVAGFSIFPMVHAFVVSLIFVRN